MGSSFIASVMSCLYTKCGQGFILSFYENGSIGLVRRSTIVLKSFIEKSSHGKTSPEFVSQTARFLVEEGKYTDVYEILTAMLDTIDEA